MSKSSGLGDNFYIGGYDLSGDLGAVDQVSGGPALLDVTAIKRSAMERIGGLRDGDMQFTTFWEYGGSLTPDFEHDVLSALPAANVVASYFRGTTLGNPAASLTGKQLDYDPTRDTSGNLTMKVEVQANGFGLDWGLQATPGLRTDTAATHGTSLDNGASTSFGAQAFLQVIAFSGTDCTVTVQHSADDSTYTTLGAFTAVTAGHGAQRIAVTGTVDEYIRVSTTTTGGFASITFAVQVTRNLTAVSF